MLFGQSKIVPDIKKLVIDACDYADAFYFTDPESTTYRLRHALQQLKKTDDLENASLYAELAYRGAMLPSELRSSDLKPHHYNSWLSIHSNQLGNTKLALKNALRQPWRDNYNWLGQSLAHSTILQDPAARRAYEQLAINYRLQSHLHKLHLSDTSVADTTKTGYLIEQVLPTAPQIVSKSNRLINRYYQPNITA